MFYEIYEKDELLEGNLRKAPKLTFRAIHPGNNNQDVLLVLTIFDETTLTVIKGYFPDGQPIFCLAFISFF